MAVWYRSNAATDAVVPIRYAAKTVAVERVPLRLTVDVVPELLADPMIPASAKLLWTYLKALEVGVTTQDLSQTQIARALGVNVCTVKTATRCLVSCGYLVVVWKSGKRGTYRYVPTNPNKPVDIGVTLQDFAAIDEWNRMVAAEAK